MFPISLPWSLVAALTIVVFVLLLERPGTIAPMSSTFDPLASDEQASAAAGSFSLLWRRGAPTTRKLPVADSRTMSVLVTGAAGFVGFHTSQALKRAGHAVVGLDNFNAYYDVRLKRDRAAILQSVGVEVVEGDVCDGALLTRLLREHNVNRVLHLAAQAGVRYSLRNPLAYVESNVRCFTVLLDTLRQHAPDVPLVFASSSSVYGLNTKVPFAESDVVVRPASLYAATKASDELLAHVYYNLYGMRMIGLRFFTVYGPWGRPDMAYFSFSNDILSGTPIQIFNHGKVSRDFTYIDDIVDGVIAALLRAPSMHFEIFNLGNNKPHGVLELVESLESHLNALAIKNFTEQAQGDVLTTFADISKAAHLLGYAPRTSLQEGLSRFCDWYLGYRRESK